MLITDFSGARAHAERAHCPVPPGVLARLTGGHGAGQLWLVAALWGVGKTFKLVDHAVAAAEGGWDVVFFSLEMTTEDILTRLRAKVLCRLAHPLMAIDLDVAEQLVARLGHPHRLHPGPRPGPGPAGRGGASPARSRTSAPW